LVAAGVLIGLVTACGSATNGAQPAPSNTQATTSVSTPAAPATTTPAAIPATSAEPVSVPGKVVPADIRFANGGCNVWPALAPASFTVSCDSSTLVRQATWSAWDHSRAVGSGMLGFDDCEPNCAVGKFAYYRVTMQFDTPVPGPCGPTWGDEAFVFLAKPPAGLTLTQRNGQPAMVLTRKAGDACQP
jgi:hypothetical protein